MKPSDLIIYARRPTLLPETRSTGYRGWMHPRRPMRFRGIMPPLPIIPRSEWPDRIRAMEGTTVMETDPLPAKDQNGLNYCWAYGSVRAVEYLRQREGLPYLSLSPESVAGPCTHWQNQGGYASEAFGQLQTAGACESSLMDRPHSLDPSKWDQSWMQNATSHETVDWVDLEYTDENGPFDNVITALINRQPVAAGLSWWGHLVCFTDAILLPKGTHRPNTPSGDTVAVIFQNSWGASWPKPGMNGFAILTEAYATPDGAAIPVRSL